MLSSVHLSQISKINRIAQSTQKIMHTVNMEIFAWGKFSPGGGGGGYVCVIFAFFRYIAFITKIFPAQI